MKQKNKMTALVTGASSGIGFEFSKLLAGKGINLVIASRGKEKLMEIKKDFERSYGINVNVIQSDLSLSGAAEELFQECGRNNLSIDVLINNAGSGVFGESLDNSTIDIEKMLNLNILSMNKLCLLFGSKMKEKGEGFILNVGSLVGKMPIPYFASYAASKSYVINYSIALHTELKSKGITVTCLLPGFVNTNFDANSKISQGRYLKISQQNAMQPSEVARIGIKALFKGKPIIIAGVQNKIAGFFIGLMPKVALSKIERFFISGLIKP